MLLKLASKDCIFPVISYPLDAAKLYSDEMNCKAKKLNTNDIIKYLGKLVGFRKLSYYYFFINK